MGQSGSTSPKKSKTKDNLEATRIVRDALRGFTPEEQKKILRWAAEILGINSVSSPTQARGLQQPPAAPAPLPQPNAPKQTTPTTSKNVKTFVDEKQPQTDIQLATAI